MEKISIPKPQSKKEKSKKSSRGSLSKYADLSKIKDEEGAWQRHVIEKYKNR